MSGARGPGPLGLLGAFLLGTGLASRLLVSQSAGALASAAPALLLLAGGGVLLLERALREGGTPGWPCLVLPLLVLPGLLPLEARGMARGLDLLAALACGLGLRCLVAEAGMRRALLQALVALAAFLSLHACAESLYLQSGALEALQRADLPPALQGPEARAFLDSRRASASFFYPNTYAAFMLLVLPLAALTLRCHATRRAGLIVAGPCVAGFLCAGSLGAGLSLCLVAGLLLVRNARQRGARVAAVLMLLACVLAAALLLAELAGLTIPAVGSKAQTFLERLRYHGPALQLLAEIHPGGIGLEAFGPLARTLTRPGDSWSWFVHDSWLQLLIECGPLVLAGIPALLLVLRAGPGGVPDERAAPGPCARPFRAGILLGCALAAPLAPALSFAPPGSGLADATLLTALGTLLPVGALLLVLQPLAPDGRDAALAWRVGMLALVAHALLDLDLYDPGVACALGACAALAPWRVPRLGGARRPFAAALGLLLLIAPIPTCRLALDRQRLSDALRDADRPVVLELATGPVLHERALGPGLVLLARDLRARQAEARLEALPATLRRRPLVRLAEARYLVQRAAVSPGWSAEARRRLEALRIPGARIDVDLLHQRFLLERAARDARARETAREVRAAARAWRLTEREAPFLAELPR